MMLWFALGRRFPVWVTVLVALIGAADEIHQMFLPGRYAEMDDWLADVGGACMPLLASMTHRNIHEKT
jgi:VanZ family protein